MSKVTIISGVYNAEKYLKKCLDSIINQSYQNFEVILIVNASKDKSKEIVQQYEKKYPEKIRAFYTEEKLGAGGSRKFGLSKATGEYICFVDCDDVLEKNSIQKMIHTAEKEQNCDLIICDFQKFNNDGKILYKRKFKNEKKALIQSVAPWAKLYRKDFLEKKKLTFQNVPFGEDILFTTDLYLANPKVFLCHYIGYSWRENLQSTSHTELRGFPLETVEKAKEYFKYLDKKYSYCSQKLMYFKFKYFVWYLLQSGRDVQKENMKLEYNKAFSYLHNEKEWKEFHCNKIWGIQGERMIVKIVLVFIRILEEMHISGKFFAFYAQSFLGNFWPSL